MHTTGKILVFLAVIFSFVFMTFAVATYFNPENFRLKHQELATDQRRLQNENNVLQDIYATIETNANNELDEIRDELRQLTQQRDQLLAQVEQLRSGGNDAVAAKVRELRVAREQIQGEVTEQARAVEEMKTVREALVNASGARDTLFEQAVRLNDEFVQMESEIGRLEQRQVDRGERIAVLRDLANRHNLSESTLAQPPGGITGRILRLNAQERLVELSIGSDDGIREGHELQVYRPGETPRFLGTVQIVRVDSDRSVGRVTSMRAAIERDDRVTPRLR